MKLPRYFRRVRARLNRPPANVYRAVDEEDFWDDYVKRWQNSADSRAGIYLGSDWQYAEEFLALLKQYASLDKDALEVGCGGGRITAPAITLFRHVFASDLSNEMLQHCRATLGNSLVSFHKLDGFTLEKFADDSVDVVFAHDVFVQLSSIQVYSYLAEFRRVLRRGGVGLVSCYDFGDRFEMFKNISLKFWQRRMAAPRRLHFVTEEMLRLMLSDLALEMLNVHRGRFLTVAFRK
jgi:ubiquinone/menaquinone biosynthesis C-methylase UbiE